MALTSIRVPHVLPWPSYSGSSSNTELFPRDSARVPNAFEVKTMETVMVGHY